MRLFTQLGVTAMVAAATLAAGCRTADVTPPLASPNAQAAPPLSDEVFGTQYHGSAPSPAPTDYRALFAAETLRSPGREPEIVSPVAVVLMPALPFADAGAVVVRRRALKPNNVIMLRADSLTLGTFGAAIKTVSHEVQESGVAPPSTYMLKVQGHAMIKTFQSAALRRMTLWELDSLRRVPIRTIEGIGARRAIVIDVVVPITSKNQ